MKTIFISLTVILLFSAGQMISAQEIMTHQRDEADKPGIVRAHVANPSAEESQILKDLEVARKAGDHETAQILQASLDRIHGVTISKPSFIQEPPVLQNGIAETTPPNAFLWGGDTLISDPDNDYIKPSITRTYDGDLYAAMECANNNRIYIYRSLDGGASWSSIYWIGGGDDCRNPSAAYGENANGDILYVGFEVISGGLQGVNVLHLDVNDLSSYDTYVEWGINMPGSEQVYPKICTDNLFYINYYIYVTYEDYGIDYYPVMFSRSTDEGLTYSTPANITGGSENSTWNTHPDIAFGTSGLFVAFEKPGWSGASWLTQPWVTESNDWGSSSRSGCRDGSRQYRCSLYKGLFNGFGCLLCLQHRWRLHLDHEQRVALDF
jgi:hypothetical protein